MGVGVQRALAVDIRSETQRASDGCIAGAIFHPRNVLEWRCDPGNEGCQSSLAAATLQELGFARATDPIGGFRAWVAAGLPVMGRQPAR
jgi:rhodanese-related sulfurtransferase